MAVAGPARTAVVEYWNPYRSMFDWVWSGRRHVMMGATQVDRFGNQNLAAIGDYAKPKVQLLGYRGAPGNTINDTTSYWVPNHGPKVFVEAVDIVSGIGWDRAAALGDGGRFVEIRRVVSNLGVFDFDTADHSMRLRVGAPGRDRRRGRGGHRVRSSWCRTTCPSRGCRRPTSSSCIREVIDPDGTREREVPDPAP